MRNTHTSGYVEKEGWFQRKPKRMGRALGGGLRAAAERGHHAWATAWVSLEEHGSRSKETRALQLEPFGEAAGVEPACWGLRRDGDGRN